MAGPNAPTRYPTGGDYVDALQYPARAFTDPQLRDGVVKADAWGLPEPVSGNFASVFQVAATDGTRWAVKCFTRPVADQQRRYQAVSTALRQVRHPALVDFDYQPAGISINSHPYPLVKMRWIDAQGLLPWLENHRANAARVTSLAAQLAEIVSALEDAGVAHGDLQHGNLLVTPDTRLMLIDYDGMFVPALRGLPPTEKGLPNYQHPDRDDHHFGPGLDRFSAWVIYTSLIALTVEPTLWRNLRDPSDDTKILLAAADYADPANSPAFRALRTTGHHQLTSLTDTLASCAAKPLSQVPKLETSMAPAVVPRPRVPAAPGPSQSLPEWLADHLPTPAATAPPVAETSAGIDDLRFGGGRTMIAPRLAAITCLAAIGSAIAASAGATALAAIPMIVWWLTAASMAILVAWLYRRHPQAVARRRALAVYADARNAVRQATKARDDAQQQLAQLGATRDGEQRRIAQRRAEATQQRQTAEQAITSRLQQALAQIAAERNAPQNSLAELQRLALQQLRTAHVERALANAVILSKPPAGIDTKVARNLAAAGFRTAADFVDFYVVQGGRYPTAMLRRSPQDRGVHVEQVGPVRAENLVRWRESIRGQAERTAPATLPTNLRQSIASSHHRAQQVLQAREQAVRDEARKARDQAAAAERQTLSSLDQEQAKLDADMAATQTNRQRRLSGAMDDLDSANHTLQRHADAFAAYHKITFPRYLAAVTAIQPG
ncbi:MAG TPA: protein kinase [Micromonosporaceae bacterium]|nr:protein kinase [Micromonosporaceae bacterium]